MLKDQANRVRPVNMTAGDKAYETIRALILEGRFAPGEWLREEDLTSVCGVSRTPIREAIRRLVAEGLIVKNPRFGAQVATIAAAELEEIYTLRAMVESHASARAATRIGEEQIARLKELASVMERAATAGDEAIRTRYTHANAEFHRIILEAAHSPRLSKMAALLVELPLTLRTLANYTLEDRQRSLRHHRELIAAFQARSPQWASAAMQSHVHAALHALLRSAEPGAESAA